MNEEQKKSEKKITRLRDRRSKKPVIWILWISFGISFITLIIYLIDLDYSDETLILLLRILWYSSFMVCVCAFYKLFESVYYFFRRRRASRSLKIIPSVLFIIYSLSVIFLESLITVFSRGNI